MPSGVYIRTELHKQHMSESLLKNPRRYWKGKQFSDEHKKNISKSVSGKKHHMYGKHHSESTKEKLRVSCSKNSYWNGKTGPNKGIRPSRKSRERMSIAGRERRLGMVTPAFNPIACQRIDEYGQKYGYHFQHALNGGEVHIVGYSVDGYDKEKNTVIEYYEKYHDRPEIKVRDTHRKREIIKHLGCRFIELKEMEMQ